VLGTQHPLALQIQPRLRLTLAFTQAQIQIGAVLDAVRDHDLQQELQSIRRGSGALTVAEARGGHLDGLNMDRDDLLWSEPLLDEPLAQEGRPVEGLLGATREVRGEDVCVRLDRAGLLGEAEGLLRLECHPGCLRLAGRLRRSHDVRVLHGPPQEQDV